MNARVKSFLKALGLYYVLQGTFRASISYITRVVWRRRYAPYRGRGFRCNFCGVQYERFVPEFPSADIAPALQAHGVIAGYGKNVFCPQCGSKNRERLVKAVMEDRLEFRNRKILHLSPEPLLHRWLAPIATVTSADLEPGLYRRVDPAVRQADATRFGFADACFDLVIANHVLEHIADDAQAMREFFRVLKPGGVAVLQIPFSPSLARTIEYPGVTAPRERAQLFGQRDHVRIYALADYLQRLAVAGFRLQVLGPDELAGFHELAIQDKEVVVLGWKD